MRCSRLLSMEQLAAADGLYHHSQGVIKPVFCQPSKFTQTLLNHSRVYTVLFANQNPPNGHMLGRNHCRVKVG